MTSELAEIRRDVKELRKELEADREQSAVFREQWDFGSIVWLATPLIIVDLASGQILQATPSADELFGFIPGALTGMSVHDLLPTDLREQHAADFKSYALDPQKRRMGTRGVDLVGQRRDGQVIKLAIDLYPVVARSRQLVVGTILRKD